MKRGAPDKVTPLKDDLMAENGLPSLDLLKATPGILRALMTEVTEADARWKPAPECFSVTEVLAQGCFVLRGLRDGDAVALPNVMEPA